MRILFLNKTRADEFRDFDYASLEGLRGAERTSLYLAEALGARGHEVVLTCAGAPDATRIGHVTVASPAAALAQSYDVAISNNFAKAFDGVAAPVKMVWTHNPGFARTHLKADLLAKWRHKPHLVHLSQYTRKRSWMLPRSGDTIIHHGMPADFLDARAARDAPPPPIAVFASYPGRNLRKVVRAWCDVVHPRVPQAKLIVTSDAQPKHLDGRTPAELRDSNIEIRGTVPWTQLMDLLRTARVFIAPGHWQETYNLLAIEAAACGVPTVTMGIGALRERVIHDQTGCIEPTIGKMGAAITRILTDDALWQRYHRACLSHPDLISWEQCADEWERRMTALAQSARDCSHAEARAA